MSRAKKKVMKKNSIRYLVLLAAFMAVLPGCSAFKDDEPKLEADQDVNLLYDKAADAMDQKNYFEATHLFEEVERQHPYSEWATRAEPTCR